MAGIDDCRTPVAGRPPRRQRRKTLLRKVSLVAFFVLSLTGCRSLSHYVSPRITGCVIDAGTRQPVQGVKVSRNARKVQSMDPVKGGQALEQPPSTVTDHAGWFTLESVRSLTPFRKTGWYSIGVSLVHPAYERFSTNFTLANATNTAKGEPMINTGVIPLARKLK